MTRINSAIPPKNLTDQHLVAELRELPRIFTSVLKRVEKGRPFNDIPKKFTLGPGHCKFFYDKTLFLQRRHCLLQKEYRTRFNREWPYKPEWLAYEWETHIPTQEERDLLIERISTRISESNQIPRYYGRPISKEEAIENLKK